MGAGLGESGGLLVGSLRRHYGEGKEEKCWQLDKRGKKGERVGEVEVPIEHVGDHFDFCFCSGYFLGGGELRAAAEEEGHGGGLSAVRWRGGGVE